MGGVNMKRWTKGMYVLDLRLTTPEGATVTLTSKKGATFSPGIISRASEIVGLWMGVTKEVDGKVVPLKNGEALPASSLEEQKGYLRKISLDMSAPGHAGEKVGPGYLNVEYACGCKLTWLVLVMPNGSCVPQGLNAGRQVPSPVVEAVRAFNAFNLKKKPLSSPLVAPHGLLDGQHFHMTIDVARGLPVEEKKVERELLAGWWEIWWKKPGERPVLLRVPDGEFKNPHIPAHAFPSRAEAFARKKLERNPYHVVVHVRRYRKKKGGV